MSPSQLPFLTFLACLHFSSCSEDCFKLDVSVTQKVENEGFHRNVHWLLEMQAPKHEMWTQTQCNMSLLLDVNAGMFVNPDEIEDLNRMGELSVRIIGEVNIETPAHESVGHLAYIYVPNKSTEKMSLILPIHLRYQRAQITGGFGKVLLRKPSLLATCVNGVNQICGKNGKLISAPCDVNGGDSCVWKNVTYQALFEEVELFVPIGDLDDFPLVSIVTLLLGCAGCIYILSILSTAPL